MSEIVVLFHIIYTLYMCIYERKQPNRLTWMIRKKWIFACLNLFNVCVSSSNTCKLLLFIYRWRKIMLRKLWYADVQTHVILSPFNWIVKFNERISMNERKVFREYQTRENSIKLKKAFFNREKPLKKRRLKSLITDNFVWTDSIRVCNF